MPQGKSAAESLATRQRNNRDMATAVLFAATNGHLNEQVITVDSYYVDVAVDSLYLDEKGELLGSK